LNEGLGRLGQKLANLLFALICGIGFDLPNETFDLILHGGGGRRYAF
jgi:hypothetical protein